MAKNTTEVGSEIRIPPAPNASTSASDDQLANMQRELFKKPVETNGNGKAHEEGEVKDRASEIFQKTQETNQKLKTGGVKNTDDEQNAQEGEGGEEEFSGNIPEFDASEFFLEVVGKKEEETQEVDDDIEADEGEIDVNESKGEKAPDLNKEDNLKNLRKVAGTFKQERDEARAKIEELQRRVEAYPDVSGLEKQVTTLTDRIKELEKYELVFGLQNSPLYKDKFLAPTNQILQEVKQIVTDYGIDEDVAEEILLIDNRRDLDETLDEMFSSISARNDVKALKQKYDGIQRERAEFEKKPQEALSKFNAEQAQLDAEVNQRRDAHLKQITDEGWVSALAASTAMSGENKIYELIEQPGKKDHNDKVVRPTLNNAREMVQVGLDYIEKLSRNKAVMTPKFVQWFAQICQQAAATQMVNQVRYGLYNKYSELLEQQTKQSDYDRPGISPTTKTAPDKKGKLTGTEAAAKIFEDVMSRN